MPAELLELLDLIRQNKDVPLSRREFLKLSRDVGTLAFALLRSSNFRLPELAPGDTLPPSCFAADGLVNLATCPENFLEISRPLLAKGFHDELGYKVPNLPPPELQAFDAGTHLMGSMLAMTQRHSNYWMPRRAKAAGNNPKDYVGGFAADSKRYLNTVVFVRVLGSQSPWVGPLYVFDCAADVHQYGRAMEYGSVGEADWATYRKFGTHGAIHNLEFVFQDAKDLTPPPLNVDPTTAVNYSQAWLTAGGYTHS